MRCSNRCANPVLPGRSFFEPTWYQTLTATMGALWSSGTTSVSPFPRTNFLKEISISWANKGAKTNAISSSAVAGARRERRMGPPLEECSTDQWGGPLGLPSGPLRRGCSVAEADALAGGSEGSGEVLFRRVVDGVTAGGHHRMYPVRAEGIECALADAAADHGIAAFQHFDETLVIAAGPLVTAADGAGNDAPILNPQHHKSGALREVVAEGYAIRGGYGNLGFHDLLIG